MSQVKASIYSALSTLKEKESVMPMVTKISCILEPLKDADTWLLFLDTNFTD